jgi:DNA polymerase-3 subunit epsilon
MREIVLDTETTGFDPEQGDRIVEIGCVELYNHMPTGETYHVYINPERPMPEEAFKVHGLGDDFLRDKPKFAEVGQSFLDFVRDAKLVIHNASFDMKFLNAELRWMNLPQLPMSQALDTLEIARKRFPGAPASLDALCRRFAIDNSSRTLHGALLDSEILVWRQWITAPAPMARFGVRVRGPIPCPLGSPRKRPPPMLNSWRNWATTRCGTGNNRSRSP